MPIESTDPIIALCTFTPEGGSAFSLGTDDCWVESFVEPGKEVIVVHAQHVGRLDSPIEITGVERAPLELLGIQYNSVLKKFPLVEYLRIDSTPVYAAAPDAVKGLLENPFTGLSFDNCYCTDIDVNDTGGRVVLVDITFERPLAPSSGTIDTADFTWDGTNLGNQPGTWDTNVDNSFIRYTAKMAYNGASIESYVSTLSEAIGFYPLVLHSVPRGSAGSRGIIKSYNQAAGDLVWISRAITIQDVYPESISASGLETGVLQLELTFIKAR